MVYATPMPALSSRTVQSVPGGIGDLRANHPVRPAADHPLRDDPAKTRRAALDAAGPARPYYRRPRRPGQSRNQRNEDVIS
jgi:hypothetical protein